MTTLHDRINALHAAGATDVTVHADGSVSGTLPPRIAREDADKAERDLREKWARWYRNEELRQREAAVQRRNCVPVATSTGAGVADICLLEGRR